MTSLNCNQNIKTLSIGIKHFPSLRLDDPARRALELIAPARCTRWSMVTEGFVRVNPIMVLEPVGSLGDDGLRIGSVWHANIVPFDRPDERPVHAVGSRPLDRCLTANPLC